MKCQFFRLKQVYLVSLFLLLISHLHAQQIIFSEIGWNSNYNATTFGGIIEIANKGNAPVDLTGYIVEDASTGYIKEDNITILSYDTVGCGDDMVLKPNEVLSVFRFLNKNSQTINLYTPNKELVSSVTWGNSPDFMKASAAQIWNNGPTPLVPENGAIVNIGNGTSWLDWVSVAERTPCIVENNSERTARKNIVVYKAEKAKRGGAKIQEIQGAEKVVSMNKEHSHLEWIINVEKSGIFDVFLNYKNFKDDLNATKGMLTINDRSYSLMQFENNRLITSEEDASKDKTWINEFTKAYLNEGDNIVRFTTTEDIKKNELFINYLGLVDQTETNNDMTFGDNAILGSLPKGYSQVQSGNAGDEWISNFSLGTIDNNSGSSVLSDFSEVYTELIPGKIYSYNITPAWSGTIYNEGYAIWIDYNRDGSFDEGEKVVAIPPSRVSKVHGSFTVPKNAIAGPTMIRVIMKYNDMPTLASTNIDSGEVENYVGVIGNVPLEELAVAEIKEAISLFPNPVIDILNIDMNDEIESLEVYTMQGQLLLSDAKGSKTISLKSLNSGSYILKINSNKGVFTKQLYKTE